MFYPVSISKCRKREFLALMGPSGSGKSTLLNLIGGLDRPTSGTVQIGEDRVDQLSDRQLAAWRARHIGFVFQFYNLLPALSAERNVELPLLLTNLNKAARRQHVAAALAAVGLTHRAKAFPAHSIRRRAAARRHRPRHRHRSHGPALRRAHRRPRPQVRRRDPHAAPDAQQGPRQDHHHGHPRSRTPPPAPAAPCISTRASSPTKPRRMKFLPLVWAGLKRKKLRTALTFLSIFVAFMLFAFLGALKESLGGGVSMAGQDRLITRHKVSLIQTLPESYKNRIAADARRRRGLPPDLVRRHLSGSEEFLRHHAGRAGGVPRHVSGIRAQGLGKTGVARHPHRSHRRPHDGGPLQVENRRPHPHPVADLGPARRDDAVGV